MHNAVLILENGQTFYGTSLGKIGITTGEVCFTTNVTGYQHTITDPSFAQQIITFTFPHIGNVGVNNTDFERNKTFARGVVLRELPTTQPSHISSTTDLDTWLAKNNIVGIYGVDTREITKQIRTHGAMRCVIYSSNSKINNTLAKEHLIKCPNMEGQDLALHVSGIGVGTARANSIKNKKVVIIDFGMKEGIKKSIENNVDVIVVRATKNFSDIAMTYKPHGIILSNGPGDPEATAIYATPQIQNLIKHKIPIFGICLGHQLLAISLGCKTIKMKVGHRGANHPVYNTKTQKVEISSQNHGFVIDEDSIPNNVQITHRSLFDNTIEGIKLKNQPVFSVQYHPEGAPGPNDSHYLFQEFLYELN